MFFLCFATNIVIIHFIINCPQCLAIARQRNTNTDDMETLLNRLRGSVDRFDAHFQRIFNEYGRTESVRELIDDKIMPQFELEQHSRTDFVVAFQQLQQRLQHFFDSKMGALRRLVGAAEKAAHKLDVDTELGPTLGREQNCSALMNDLNASSVRNARNWRRSGGNPKSGIHIALEVYKCSGAVKRDFDWTRQAIIEQSMLDNVQKDAALMRQYIGTYGGLTRIFPGFKWDVGPEQFSMDLFDPRFRPWFTAAESAPKDVLFLLDFSGSAKGLFVHLIKTSVMTVLQTLSPNDFFTGIWYNSRRELVLANCTDPRGDTFVPATSRNKAMLPPALEKSFAQFVRADHHQQQNNNNGTEATPPRFGERSGGHRLVLLFTDGVEFWPTDIVQRFQQRQQADGLPPIRVFGHSIGHGHKAQPALAWLTCQTMAGLEQVEIGSVAEVRLKARAHLAKLSEVLALAYRQRALDPERRSISWPSPYMDVQKGGAVLSLSMPVLGPQSGIYRDLNLSRQKFMEGNLRAKLDGFIAVAGVDIAFTELIQQMSLEGEDGTLAYTFLTDNNGLVYFHPRLKTPAADVFAVRRTVCHRIATTPLRSNTRVPFSKADELVHQQLGYVDTVPHRDLLELEPDTPLMRQFRARLVRRQCATPLEDAQRQLRCAVVNGTPLVIGMVLMKDRFRVSISKHHIQNGDEKRQKDEVDPFELTDRFRSAGFLTESDQQHPAKEEAATTWQQQQFITKNDTNYFDHQSSVGFLLSPGTVKQWELSTALSSVRPLSRLSSLIHLLPSLGPDNPFLAQLSALSPDSVLPLWASSWRSSASSSAHRFSSSAPAAAVATTCNPRPLPLHIDSRMFRSAFLQFRASALRGRASLSAFFPRCEFKSVHPYLSSSLSADDDNNENSDDKLRVEVGPVSDANTDSTLTVLKSMAFVGGTVPLVQIGVQLRSHFFRQKFQKALQQQQGGWHECAAKAGRKCLLVTDRSMVLASSDPDSTLNTGPTGTVAHLSNAEPELFAQLLSHGFIHKVVWRENDARCPMVITLDHRQLQRQQYLQQHMMMQHQSTPTLLSDSSSTKVPLPSVPSLRTISSMLYSLRQLISLLVPSNTFQWPNTSFIWWLLPVSSMSDAVDDNGHHHLFAPLDFPDCDLDNNDYDDAGGGVHQPTELMEQCTVEHTQYRLRGQPARGQWKDKSGASGMPSRGVQGAIWMKDKQCNRTIGLLPFARSHLFLLLIVGSCDTSAETTANASRKEYDDKYGGTSLPLFPQFVPQKQVPNCELTRSSLALERALRPDLDYTLSHPMEFNPICTFSAQQQRAQFSALFLLFSLIISSYIFRCFCLTASAVHFSSDHLT